MIKYPIYAIGRAQENIMSHVARFNKFLEKGAS